MKTHLDQWEALVALHDSGSISAAAEQLRKSQSAISYQLAQLQQLLGTEILEQSGRTTRLNATGRALLDSARRLLKNTRDAETLATQLQHEWEPELRVAVEMIFPETLLFDVLEDFASRQCGTRLQLLETVLSGAEEALLEGRVDIAITPIVPLGFVGDPILPMQFVAVASPDHPLVRAARELDLEDLVPHRQVVVRDSGTRRQRDAGWLDARERWTVSHIQTSIQAVRRGLGFAWLPRTHIAKDLEQRRLLPLPLRHGQTRNTWIQRVFARHAERGQAAQLLDQILRERCAAYGNRTSSPGQ